MRADASAQSPIDVTDPRVEPLTDIQFDYRPSSATVVNNGHTVQANVAPGSSVRIDGTTFERQQFHFHAPGEHTIKGTSRPVEFHFVHRSRTGEIAVVDVLAREGAANPAWQSLIEAMPASGEQRAEGIDLEVLLSIGRTTIRYEGSLATPHAPRACVGASQPRTSNSASTRSRRWQAFMRATTVRCSRSAVEPS